MGKSSTPEAALFILTTSQSFRALLKVRSHPWGPQTRETVAFLCRVKIYSWGNRTLRLPSPILCSFQNSVYIPSPTLKEMLVLNCGHNLQIVFQTLHPKVPITSSVVHWLTSPYFSVMNLLHRAISSVQNLLFHFCSKQVFCVLRFFMPRTPWFLLRVRTPHLTK